jgi:hypothetical protein
MTRQIFVFGSNLAGMHGGGSAAAAHKEHGAIWGEGVGPHGNSYAIPTLDQDLQRLALYDIAAHVGDFIEYAKLNSEWSFNIVAIGCGIAGFRPEEIAPMFKGAPLNCNLPGEFLAIIEKAAA